MTDKTSRPRAAVKRGNIHNEPEYDPFPKSGLVKQYEPFIRARVGAFCKQYPLADYKTALFEAVRIAVEFEPKFKAETGYDFSTPLRWHLRGLKRILIDGEKSKHLIHVDSIRQPLDDDYSAESNAEAKTREAVAEEIAKQRVADGAASAAHDRRTLEERLEALPATYGTGGNGARVRLDLNGPVIGGQLFANIPAVKEKDRFDYDREMIDQLGTDLRTLTGDRPALMRAVIAHHDRRQREREQEAENQRSGDYGPVFLEARDTLRPDIQFRPPKKAVTPRRHKPSESPDLKRLYPVLREYHEDREALLLGAAEALRPSLDDRERAVLDWLMARDRTLTALASEIDITKGYASKLQGRILNQLRKRMTDRDQCLKLIERGRTLKRFNNPNDR